MYHIDNLNKVVFCKNTWDCYAPGVHYSNKDEAEAVALDKKLTISNN